MQPELDKSLTRSWQSLRLSQKKAHVFVPEPKTVEEMTHVLVPEPEVVAEITHVHIGHVPEPKRYPTNKTFFGAARLWVEEHMLCRIDNTSW